MADRDKEEVAVIQEMLDYIDRTLEPYTMTESEAEALDEFMETPRSEVHGTNLPSLNTPNTKKINKNFSLIPKIKIKGYEI